MEVDKEFFGSRGPIEKWHVHNRKFQRQDNEENTMRYFFLAGVIWGLVVTGCTQNQATTKRTKPYSRHVTWKPAIDAPSPNKNDDSNFSPMATSVQLGSPELLGGIPGTGPLTKADLTAWLEDSGT
ncbi:MAG: hypothetical protein R3C28_26560 [Pirellulaceae bacterium]